MSKSKSNSKNVYRRGDRWYYRFTVNGREQRRVIPGATTEAEAIEMTKELRVLQPVSRDPEAGVPTEQTMFDTMMLDFLETYCKDRVKKSTAKRYEVSAKPLTAFFGGKNLAKLRRSDIAEFVTARRRGFTGAGTTFPPVHTATIRRDLSVLSRIYTRAINHDLLDRNPVAAYDKSELPDAARRVRYLSPDEYEKLVAAATAECPDLGGAVVFAAHTGMRFAEQFSLTWDRVDLDAGTVRLDAKHTKTSQPRVIPLSKEALAVLKRRAVFRDVCRVVFAFVDKAGQWRVRKPAYTGRLFKRALAACGIEDFRWHDLRHHAASTWVQGGADLYPVSRLLGHSTVRTTERYAHLNTEALRRVVAGGPGT